MVALVVGTRPEVIKMAPVYRELIRQGVDTFLIATAQHREMMDAMLEVFGMKPDVDLDIMRHSQSINYVFSSVMSKLEVILSEIKPKVLLVQGDTTTALSAALTAFHLSIPVGHVEAGLRSGVLKDPFPEEMNRRVIDVVSDHLFAPTERARENLIHEGIDEGRIHVVGNTVVDALEMIKEGFDLESMRRKIIDTEDYILVTLHRRENIGDRMRNILRALRRFSDDFKIDVVFPVHRNPRVRSIVHEILSDHERSHLLEPLDYIEFLSLLSGCRFVLTDSGGIQEEAPSFGKFVVVARETTERPELVEGGWGILAGTDDERVYQALERAFEFKPSGRKNPFGDGMSAKRIVGIILESDS